MSREFHLPDLGEGIVEAQIVRLLVNEGDRVAEDQSLFEIETDKAAVEIPSPFAGVVTRLHVAAGQTVNVGDLLVAFDGAPQASPAVEVAASAPAAAATPAVAAATAPTVASATAVAEPPPVSLPPRRTKAPAAPAVRRLARELGVDIDTIEGTGPGKRVTRSDVEAAAGGGRAEGTSGVHRLQTGATVAPPPGVADADKWGPVRRTPVTQIRKTIAQQMMRSASSIPHVTHMDEADITDLQAMRRQYNTANEGDHRLKTGATRRVTVMAFIIRAVSVALRNHPVFNAGLDTERGEIVYKDYINIGIAVDTERGLIVPNVRNADRLSVAAISAELATIADNARKAQFAIEDLRGGTFTITNVGALGGVYSTPIINYPEVAILGTGKGREIPVVKEGEILVRTVMPLSLSFDHRIADGAQAARFCSEIIGYLERPATLLF